MKLKNVAAVGAIALVSALALSACSSNSDNSTGGASKSPSAAPSVDYSSLSGTITAGGSSAQANAQAAWTAAFKAQASGVTINYDKSQGSGGGVTNWLSGSYDFAGTDAALTPAQFTQAQTSCGTGGALDIPVYLSGVGIVYKLPGNPKVNLTGQLLAQIFTGKITNWNDSKIAAVNSGTTLPNLKISVVHRSDGSGTTANFSTYLSQTDPTDWTTAPGTAWPNNVGSGQQGGSGVVNTVEAGSGTIGYADQSSVPKTATLAAIQVGTSGSNFSTYTAAGATEAFSQAATDASQGAGDLTKALKYTQITSTSAYPIPLLSYDVLCKTFKDSTQGKLTAAYIGFVGSSTGQKVAAANAGAAPLPADIISSIQSTIATVK